MKLFNMKTLATFVAAATMFATSNVSAKTTLRFGYEAPRNDSQHIAAEKFNELLQEKAKGEIELKLFPDSTLGNSQTMISGVRTGTIDIEMSGSPNFTGLEQKLNVIDIPFIFKDREHAFKVLDGEIGQGLLKELESKNIKALAFWDVGFRALSNSKHTVTKPEDISGLKVRTNQNPMYIEAFTLLGGNPVPMPLAELYTALETRAVDAQEHPIGIFWSNKLFEVQKFLSLTNHGYTPLIVAMNKKKFDKLSPELQTALLEAAKEAGQFQRELNIKNEKEIVENLRKEGVEVTETIDQAPFKAVIEAKVRQSFIDKNGDELIKAIDALQ
ncbi:TRAP transporter substrate-binding protein [Lonepinella sp. BR2271]|uniref:TRAP transporter substrate-binding protein n=1 Tax=Lonepinella sp. BR2271 TaxID=3434550 RepID=UPI003F6E20E8